MFLGLLALLLCLPLGAVAWMMADDDLKQMEDGSMVPLGRGRTLVGRACGIVATLLLGLVLLIGLVSGTWVVLKRASGKAPSAPPAAAVAERTNPPAGQPAR